MEANVSDFPKKLNGRQILPLFFLYFLDLFSFDNFSKNP